MKIVLYTIPFIILLAVILGVVHYDSLIDVSPAINSEKWQENIQSDTIPPPGFFPTIFNFNFANIPNLNAGTVGATFLFGKYYINRWNSYECFVLPNTGPNGGPSTIGMYAPVYTGFIRDMTTDGRYLYGGKASNKLYKMDTAYLLLLNEFTLTGNIRGVAWDPNRKAFWYCDFSGIIQCRDTANVQKAPGIPNTLVAKYGLGFDSTSSADSAFLFVWSQETTQTNRLSKFFITPAVPELINDWIFNRPQEYIASAGGAEIVIDPYTSPPRLILLLNYQNFALVGYKLKDVLTGLEAGNETVRDFMLHQNYPNPFNPMTKISFILSKAGLIKLEVFNSLGEKVATVFNGYTQAGEHEYLFDASNLSSGVYYYKLIANNVSSSLGTGFTQTKKMILVK